MSIRIHSVPLGMNHCYVIQENGTIMVDGGFPGTARAFKKALAKLNELISDSTPAHVDKEHTTKGKMARSLSSSWTSVGRSTQHSLSQLEQL